MKKLKKLKPRAINLNKLKELIHSFEYRKYLLLTIFSLFAISSCSQINLGTNEPEITTRTFTFDKRSSIISNMKKIEMTGHINIQHPRRSGDLFAEIEYNSLDSLSIQFKDMMGRKLAMLWLNSDQYELWLQRKEERFEGNSLPESYAYLTLDNKLTLNEFRRILLALPISNTRYIEDTTNISNDTINFVSKNDLVAKTVLDESQSYIKKILITRNEKSISEIHYRRYKSDGSMLMPTYIIIKNLDNPYQIGIKLSDFSFKRKSVS